jgi:hypothetical protein
MQFSSWINVLGPCYHGCVAEFNSGHVFINAFICTLNIMIRYYIENNLLLVEISGSQGDEYEYHCPLECCAVSSYRNYRYFRGVYCLYHQGILVMEAVSTSETPVNFYQNTRRNIPEDSHIPRITKAQLLSTLNLSDIT